MIHADVQLLEHDVKRTQARILEKELDYLNKQLGHVATQAALLASISFSSFNVQEGHLDLISLPVQIWPTFTGALAVGLAFCTLIAAVFVRLWGSTEALRAQNEAHLRKAVLTFREERDFVVRLLMYTIICSVCNMSTVGFLYWATAPAFTVLIIGLSGLWVLFIVYTRIKARFILCPTVFPDGFFFDDFLLITGNWKNLKLDLHTRDPFADFKRFSPFNFRNRRNGEASRHQEFSSDKMQKARHLHAEDNDGAMCRGWLAMKEKRGRAPGSRTEGTLYYFRFDQFKLQWFRTLEKDIEPVGTVHIDDKAKIKFRKMPRQRQPYAHCIEIIVGKKVFVLGSDDTAEISKWCDAFSAFGATNQNSASRKSSYGVSHRPHTAAKAFQGLFTSSKKSRRSTSTTNAMHSGVPLRTSPHNV
jgi:hypothetical protein